MYTKSKRGNHMKPRNLLAILIAIILLTFVGCHSNTPSTVITPTPLTTEDKYKLQAQFDVFTDAIFKENVQSDSITLNYTLSKPENFGITNYTPTYGSFSVEDMKQQRERNQEWLQQLQGFSYNLLDEHQQVTYDILHELLSTDIDMETYALYHDVLSSTTGMQAQLPVLLAEYNFYDQQDVKQYIQLLQCTDTYFAQICEFEKQKAEAGLFMNDTTAGEVIDQCKQFIANPEKNYLISIFNDKIKELDFTKEEQATLIEQNKAAVLEHVIPAYTTLIDTLTSLKGSGKNAGGLSHFEQGKQYYEYLLKRSTGSSRSVAEVKSLLETTMYSSILSMATISNQDQSAIQNAENVTYKLTNPKEIVTYLQTAIEKDFPALSPVNCTIKYVDPSLEEHMSPAFYLTPPIDNYSQNSVYINRYEKYDLSDIFTTIAHESYPGHLYQTVFYHQQNPSLIRSIVDFGGYSEGWATYVELYSYSMAGLDNNVAKILQCNSLANLCMYGIIDIGVNYYGWSLDDTSKYLADLNITDQSVIKRIYNYVIEEPCNYLKYVLGAIEITELKDKAQDALGDRFVLKDFHEFFLKLGPAQFDVIDKYLDQWIEQQRK